MDCGESAREEADGVEEVHRVLGCNTARSVIEGFVDNRKGSFDEYVDCALCLLQISVIE